MAFYSDVAWGSGTGNFIANTMPSASRNSFARSVNDQNHVVGWVGDAGNTISSLVNPPSFGQDPSNGADCAVWIWNGASYAIYVIPTPAWASKAMLTRVGNVVGNTMRAVGTAWLPSGGSVGVVLNIDLANPAAAQLQQLNGLQPVGGYSGGLLPNRSITHAYGINSSVGFECIAARGIEVSRDDAVAMRQYNSILNDAKAIGSVSITSSSYAAGVLTLSANLSVFYAGVGSLVGEQMPFEYSVRISGNNQIVGSGVSSIPFNADTAALNSLQYNIGQRAGETAFLDVRFEGYGTASAGVFLPGPASSISSLSRSTFYVGEPAQSLGINGSGFFRNLSTGAQTRFYWNGGDSTQNGYVNDSLLSVSLGAQEFAAPRQHTVQAVNSHVGGGNSNVVTINVVQSATALSASATNSVPRGGTFTVTGRLRANNPNDNSRGISGKRVRFTYLGRDLGSPSTDGNGNFTGYVLVPTFPINGDNTVRLEFLGDSGYAAASVDVPLTISNTAPVATMAGGAFDFSTPTAWSIGVPGYAQAVPLGSYTIEYWQRISSAGRGIGVAIGGVDTANRLLTSVPSTDGIAYFDAGNGASSRLSASYPGSGLGTWVKVVATRDISGLQALHVLRADGTVVLSTSRQTGPDFVPNGAALSVFGLADNKAADCQIDDLRIHNRALSLTEAQQRLRFEPTLLESSNLDSWQFDSVANSASPNGIRGLTYSAGLDSSASWVPSTAPLDRVRLRRNEVRQFTLGAWDPDGQALAFEIVNGPTNGQLTLSGSQATYVPANDFEGTDSFSYRVSDGSAWSAPTTVTLIVTAPTQFVTGTALINNAVYGTTIPLMYEWYSGNTLLRSGQTLVNGSGQFAIPVVASGSARLKLRTATTLLSAVTLNVATGGNTAANVSLKGGNVDDPTSPFNNEVDIIDYIVLSTDYDSSSDLPGWNPRSDFDYDGVISILDYLILSENYGLVGD